MKNFLFFLTLLSLLCFSLFSTSCKKDEDESYEIQVCIENYRSDVVYLYIDGDYQAMIPANKVSNSLFTTSDGDPVKFEVRNSSGQVLHSKTVGNGESYYVVLNAENSDQGSSGGSESSEYKDEWSFSIEITNNSSSPIHVFINGRDEKIITEDYRWTTTHQVVNQNSVSIQVKTSDGKILDSKIVTKGGSYVNIITDPTFTITKIVLNKWYTGNLFDDPDPWFDVLCNGTSVGRTGYLSDRTDGETCTWSNLNIRITNIYSKVTLDLYDYNFGYSSVGSSYVGGIVCSDFSDYWGQTSFEWSTSKMAFTIYGTWN